MVTLFQFHKQLDVSLLMMFLLGMIAASFLVEKLLLITAPNNRACY